MYAVNLCFHKCTFILGGAGKKLAPELENPE